MREKELRKRGVPSSIQNRHTPTIKSSSLVRKTGQQSEQPQILESVEFALRCSFENRMIGRLNFANKIVQQRVGFFVWLKVDQNTGSIV